MKDNNSRVPAILRVFWVFWVFSLIMVAAATPVRAAVSVDFRQDANNDAGFALGEAHWINSIVQSSNAVYFEGMGLAQRVVLKDLPGVGGDTTKHSLTFGHQWTKGGTHAFDWLMSWDQAEATGTAELSAYMGGAVAQQIISFKDGNEIAASMLPVSTNLTAGPNVIDVDVPDDPFLSANGGVPVPPAQWVPAQPRINAFELAYGNRTIRLWADAPIIPASVSLTMSHSVANGGDTGDSYVNYVLTWETSLPSTQAVIWMAAHIAVGNDSPTLANLAPGGWGDGKGASQINGGPYHFTLDRADGARLGNQDNQLKGSSIRALPVCALTGPAVVCPGSTNQYTISTDDPGATFQWYFSGSPNGASFVGSTTGSSVQVQAGACDTSFTVCVTVTDSSGLANNCCIDVTVDDNEDPTASNPDPISVQCSGNVPAPDITVVDDEADNCGTPTVAFVSDVSDGGTCPEIITRTYSVTDACGNSINVTQTITVDDTINPTASNPAGITVDCIEDVPDPDPAVVDDEADNCSTPVVTWLSDVSDNNTCPEVITRTYRVTDACGNTKDVTQTITVDDNTPPTVTCATQAAVTIAAPAVSDNCTGTPTTTSSRSDGKPLTDPYPIGTPVTVTFTVTDACGNVSTCSYVVSITGP